ncbi:hypothetical protein AAMO2058_000843400 [Amorphochlora amoebiformis]
MGRLGWGWEVGVRIWLILGCFVSYKAVCWTETGRLSVSKSYKVGKKARRRREFIDGIHQRQGVPPRAKGPELPRSLHLKMHKRDMRRKESMAKIANSHNRTRPSSYEIGEMMRLRAERSTRIKSQHKREQKQQKQEKSSLIPTGDGICDGELDVAVRPTSVSINSFKGLEAVGKATKRKRPTSHTERHKRPSKENKRVRRRRRESIFKSLRKYGVNMTEEKALGLDLEDFHRIVKEHFESIALRKARYRQWRANKTNNLHHHSLSDPDPNPNRNRNRNRNRNGDVDGVGDFKGDGLSRIGSLSLSCSCGSSVTDSTVTPTEEEERLTPGLLSEIDLKLSSKRKRVRTTQDYNIKDQI